MRNITAADNLMLLLGTPNTATELPHRSEEGMVPRVYWLSAAALNL